MKKLIAIICTLNLSISAVVPITSCSNTKESKNDEEEYGDQDNNDGTVSMTNNAHTQVQELNIASMLKEGIDAENTLTTNSTNAEAIEMFNELAQNINTDITVLSENGETDYNTKLKKGDNNLDVIIKNTKNENETQKITAKVKNAQEIKIDNAHFVGIIEGVFNKPINAWKYSVLNTYGDTIGLFEEQIIEVEDLIDITLINASESENKLVAGENQIDVRLSDDHGNSIDKEIKIINVQDDTAFANTRNAIIEGALKIDSFGQSVADRINNTTNRILNTVKSVGGIIKDSAIDFKNKIANALRGNKRQIEIQVKINGEFQNVTITVNEDKDGENEITKKLIIDTLNKFALNTDSLTTNHKYGSIIPIVQSHISGIKSSHEYSVFISPKDKLKTFSTSSNKIALTFKKWKDATVTFTHTITVGINNSSSNLNLDFIPRHINAAEFGFTTTTKWSTIVKYIQASLDSFTAKNYTIQIIDKKSSETLKSTDQHFSVLVTSKKSKSDKKNITIKISDIQEVAKKGVKEHFKDAWNWFTGNK